ncbi:MAG: hypothetical protein OEW73_08700 [Gammaproteobacteria bacterium]|nr:hypothetical protein [Gammaproteobacteria bacterium]MDH5240846.1 hypothetical protein [Gammaproteobacteria bacterium]MDH5259826.1 hypothetical protein [Gammaproteobacteria bacterium]MDH5582648.1 hypothetical protein [Gammaproteobacteria bacterium]
MNEFEFLAVFISIVVGLGVTHILYGLARIIHNRSQHQMSTLHFVWTLNVLLILLLNWWVLFLWADYETWSFDIYLLLIGWGIALYMLAVILYPPDTKAGDSYDEIFDRNRNWLFGFFIVFIALDIAQTAVRGQLLEPKIFLPYSLHYAVLAGIGIAVTNKRYQVFLAWYFLITLTLWCLIVRRLLGS